MTPEKRAELFEMNDGSLITQDCRKKIAKIIRQAIAEEREACALVAERHPIWPSRSERGKLADAIRGREGGA